MAMTVPNTVVTEHNMMLPSEFISEKETTFQYQDSLPKLPVPSLDTTMKVYLDSVKVHVSDEEYKATEAKVKSFQEGIGKTLQEKLIKRGATHRNWIEKWWSEKAYLETRCSLSPFCNFTGPGPEYKLEEGKQTENLAMTLWYMMQYYKLIKSEKLVVEKAGGKKAFDMDQVRYLFNTCRIPGEKKDRLRNEFKTAREGSSPTNIIVLCKGYIFDMNAYHQDGTLLTVPEIKHQLDYITNKCESRPFGPSIGALTSAKRTDWYHLRNHLLKIHPDNVLCMDRIEKSLFAAALDDNRPINRSQQSHAGMCGDCRNRWFDKSCTSIGFKNGASSCNCDHTPFEGLIAVHLLQYEIRGTMNGNARWMGSTHVRPMKNPEELLFHLDDKIIQAVSETVIEFNKNAEGVEVYNPTFHDFGKKYMKRVKMHPDSIMQIALQLGYYRMHGKFAPTYETGTARLFWHGRTETVRTCTLEVSEFCKAMQNVNTTDEEKIKLLDIAYKKHLDLMFAALTFKGCDRHFLGLYCICEEEGIELPEIFTDLSFIKSGGGGNFVLSTSMVGYYDIHGGMAPMVTNGYGFFYSIQDDSFRPFISRYKECPETNCTELFLSVAQSLRDIKRLLDVKVQTKEKEAMAKL